MCAPGAQLLIQLHTHRHACIYIQKKKYFCMYEVLLSSLYTHLTSSSYSSLQRLLPFSCSMPFIFYDAVILATVKYIFSIYMFI